MVRVFDTPSGSELSRHLAWLSFSMSEVGVFVTLSGYLRTREKCRKHSPAAPVFYISLVFSNTRSVADWLGRGTWNRETPSSSPALTTAGFVPGGAWFYSSAALVNSQLVCLLPVGILNLLSLFQWFVSLALKSPNGKRSIKYFNFF